MLGMKPLGSGAIMQAGIVTAIECLHYALSLPTSVVITGMDSMKILDQALEAARAKRDETCGRGLGKTVACQSRQAEVTKLEARYFSGKKRR